MALRKKMLEELYAYELQTGSQRLGKNAGHIEMLSRKIAVLASQPFLRIPALQKLALWISQLAFLRRKEMETLSEIRSIEEQHARNRKKKTLRRAFDNKAVKRSPVPMKKKRELSPLLLWMLLRLLFSDTPKKKKLHAPRNG